MSDDPVERFIEAAQAAGRRTKRNGAHWLVSCPGPKHAHGDRNPSLSVSYGRSGDCVLKCHTGCDASDIVDALDITLADLFVDRPHDAPEPARLYWLDDIYTYCDADGTVLYEVLRFDGVEL